MGLRDMLNPTNDRADGFDSTSMAPAAGPSTRGGSPHLVTTDHTALGYSCSPPYDSAEMNSSVLQRPADTTPRVSGAYGTDGSQPSKFSYLPKSVYDLGFSDRDFDPGSYYSVGDLTPKPTLYVQFPDDLPDERIFNAPPKKIAYNNLLRLAMKYTDLEIMQRANEGRPVRVFSSKDNVTARIKSALRWKATTEEPQGGEAAVEKVKATFEQERYRTRVERFGEEHAGVSKPRSLTSSSASTAHKKSNRERVTWRGRRTSSVQGSSTIAEKPEYAQADESGADDEASEI